MKNKDLADSIPNSHVTTNGYGRFTVQRLSCSTVGQDYDVFFGDENTLPSCTCYEWKKSPFLCKHFFAVFRLFPEWQWSALSPLYKESPFFRLDELFENAKLEDDIATKRQDGADIETGKLTNSIRANVELLDHFELTSGNSTPLTKSGEQIPSNCAALCRKTIKELNSITFLLEDQPEVLFKLHDDLQNLKQHLYQKYPREKGLPLLPAIANRTAGRSKTF